MMIKFLSRNHETKATWKDVKVGNIITDLIELG
jgi:hypothetical protein